jgi:hypothetical protein
VFEGMKIAWNCYFKRVDFILILLDCASKKVVSSEQDKKHDDHHGKKCQSKDRILSSVWKELCQWKMLLM